jgi:hypothetical protein
MDLSTNSILFASLHLIALSTDGNIPAISRQSALSANWRVIGKAALKERLATAQLFDRSFSEYIQASI